jgi:hypothetical protein
MNKIKWQQYMMSLWVETFGIMQLLLIAAHLKLKHGIVIGHVTHQESKIFKYFIIKLEPTLVFRVSTLPEII